MPPFVQPTVEHFAFFDALASLPDNAHTSPAYRQIVAGLLTLRMLDRWVRSTIGGPAPTLRELQSVRRAVRTCDDGAIRNALDALVTAAAESWGVPAGRVPTQAFAYARLLQQEQDWTMAADTYRSVVGCAQAVGDADLVPSAFLHMGYCYRMAGLLADAERAYGRSGATADLVRDDYHSLLSRLGLARIAFNRGNMPQAAAMLDEVIADTERLVMVAPALIEVLARARHDHGNVMVARGEVESAIPDYFDALQAYVEPLSRTRVLIDLANALASLGRRSAARDALHLCLAGTTDDESRVCARINLLDIAQCEGEETVFEGWRRALADATLAPRYQAAFHLFSGEGQYRFGRVDAARSSLAAAVAVAERHQLNEFVIRAEAALAALERHERLPAHTNPPAPSAPAVARVVDRLRAMREHAPA